LKIIHIISGILLFLLIAVSSASASSPYDITITNNGGPTINIAVEYTKSTGLLTFTDNTPSNPSGGIIGIAYHANAAAQWINTASNQRGTNILAGKHPWSLGGGDQGYAKGEFGDFITKYGKTGAVKYKTVIVQLPQNTELTANSVGNYVAVHYNYNGATYIGSEKKNNTTPIPEFPTVALPVAAILGLMFILQRRKEN
jgi:hypothetical protein